jgi:hypothetical protein
MVDSRRDDAISEVIGFVLIIALIAIIASLYLTYVVPATGRDLEIAHMDVIQNQFLDYKSTVDSLWINGQYNTQVSSPFTLGTNPGSSQGSFVNMPLFQPVTSGGTLVVNGRNDAINVTANTLYTQAPGTSTVPLDIQIQPDNLFLIFKTTNISHADSVSIVPAPATNGNWEVQLKTSPGPSTSLAITILKNSTITVNNLVIQNSIANNQSYQIDLADSSYGLTGSFVYPFGLTITPNAPNVIVTRSPNEYFGRVGATIIPSTKMGSLEYRSNNNYWISQNYIYQYGGVFLQQDNGGVVKLLPSITVTKDKSNPNLARVTINNLTIPETIPSRVGGSSLVEVLTTLQKPKPETNNLVNPSESGIPNAQSVIFKVNTAGDISAAQMWQNTFLKLQQQSDENSWISVSRTGDTVTMLIDNPNSAVYDIILDVQSNVANIYLSPTSY